MSAVRNHPARVSGALGSAATAVAYALGADAGTVAAVGAVAGLLPAAVGWLNDNGGIRGVAQTLWRGSRS